MIDWLFANIHWIILTVVVHLVVLGTVAYLILLERKTASWVQDRIGPNRVGLGFGIVPWLKDKKMFGLGQPLADGLKFIVKEDYKPRGVDTILFTLAPMVMIIVIIISIAVIPWAGWKQGTTQVDLTGVTPDQYAAVVRSKVGANGEVVGPTTDPDINAKPFLGFQIRTVGDPKKATHPYDLPTFVTVTYQYTLPSGAVKQETRDVEITGFDYRTQDEKTAVLAKLPKDARIVPNPPAGIPTDIELTSDSANPAAPQRAVATVTYRYPFQIANLNIGVLYVLAVLSLAVYGVVIGGWASNNKYSFLGGLRATANMISYEIPLGLSVLCIVVMFGTLDLGTIVTVQTGYWAGFIPAWNVFTQPLAFLMFLVCIHAEANRAPFDMAEAEQELVGGYHTEYSSMRFALFFLAEYAGMITTSAVCVALFFGGWHLPWVEWFWPNLNGYTTLGPGDEVINATESLLACLVRAGVFFGKTLLVIFVFMWVRWSLPRFRFDQLMMLAWRALIPISLALLMMTAIVVFITRQLPRPAGPQERFITGYEAILLLVANGVLLAMTFLVSQLIPPAPETNRKMAVPNSRFRRTPLPGTPVGTPALNYQAATSVAVSPVPVLGGAGTAGGAGGGGAQT